MTSRISTYMITGALALSAMAVSATASLADVRLECDATGAGNMHFHARYEERVRSTVTRKKFDAQFEVLAGNGITTGQRITFLVNNVVVGSELLKVLTGRELIAELDLDAPRDGGKPFPANWPGIHAGSTVTAKLGTRLLLGCQVK
jgi:hypothetical protein